MYRPDSDLHYKYNKQTSFSRTSIFWVYVVSHIEKHFNTGSIIKKEKNRKMVTQNISILLNNLILKNA